VVGPNIWSYPPEIYGGNLRLSSGSLSQPATAELGITLSPQWQGRGVAREALAVGCCGELLSRF